MAEITCPLCGAEMRKRKGVFNRFYGCSKYPQCRGTRPINYRPPANDTMAESLKERNARLEKDLLAD